MDMKKKIIISIALFFSLMLVLTIFTVYHTYNMGGGGMYLQFLVFVYLTAFLSVLLGGFIVYLFQKKIEAKELDKFLLILPTNERKIIKILQYRKEVEQKKLVALTGLSNVAVSRIIKQLEAKEVIEKKSYGYTNLIILK